jgi:hypothetical protein
MTVQAQVQAGISARRLTQSGLATATEDHTVQFMVDVGDCTKVWSDRRTFEATRFAIFEDIDFSAAGISNVKLLFVRNLSPTSHIALSAGWTGAAFSAFPQDTLAWNFSPMINLGSLTLRGYPIRENGSLLLSCPNSDGFGTTAGGSILRIGGTPGEPFEIYVMGT